MMGLLLVGGIAERGSLFLEIILLHDGIEVAVAESIGIVVRDFVGGADVALGASLVAAVVFIGEEEVELDLGVVNGVSADYFVEVVPLVHYLCVLGDTWSHGFLEEGPEGLDELLFVH